MRISPSIVILLGVVNDTFGAVAPSQGSSTLAIASKTKTNMQATDVARMARPPVSEVKKVEAEIEAELKTIKQLLGELNTPIPKQQLQNAGKTQAANPPKNLVLRDTYSDAIDALNRHRTQVKTTLQELNSIDQKATEVARRLRELNTAIASTEDKARERALIRRWNDDVREVEGLHDQRKVVRGKLAVASNNILLDLRYFSQLEEIRGYRIAPEIRLMIEREHNNNYYAHFASSK